MNISSQFEYLINPISKEDFFEQYFEKDFLLIQNRDKNYYDKVLKTDDIDTVLALKKIPIANIQMSKMAPVTHNYWSKLQRSKGVYLDLEKIANGLDTGHSLILNNFDRYESKLNHFVNQLQEDLLTDLWANIYITPTAFQAFERHYDTHDVFVLQIKGEKLWKLYDTPIALPHKTQSNKKFKFDLENMTPVKEILLKEGDMLYIPRGMVHEAIATDTLSIHITLGSSPPLVNDLVNGFTSKALKDEFFRASLPTSKNHVSKIDEAEFKSRLIKIIEETSFSEILEKTQNRFSSKYSNDTKGSQILHNYIKRDEFGLDSRIGKVVNNRYEVLTKGISMILKMGSREENFPFFIKPIIDTILNSDENGVAIKDIKSQFSDEDKIKTIKRFVNSGFFKVID